MQLFEYACFFFVSNCRIENSSFTPSEKQAFQRLCAVVVSDFLPFIEKCLTAIFPEDMVQQLASRTLLTLGKQQQETPAGLASVRKKVIVHVGISARDLAEPLRAVVPEVFEEIEQKRLLQSVAKLSSPTVTSAPRSLFSKPGQDGQPTAPASIGAITVATEQMEMPSHSSSVGGQAISLPTNEAHPRDNSLSNAQHELSMFEAGIDGRKQVGSAAVPMESDLNPHTKSLDGAV